MNPTRTAIRAFYRPCLRSFSTTPLRSADNVNHRAHPNAETYRKFMKEKPLNPHMTNTSSTITNEMPSLGQDSAPPELLSSVDKNFAPKDAKPEHTKHMTGGTQEVGSDPNTAPTPKATKASKAKATTDQPAGELNVGEIPGGSFRVEPLRRTGEDVNTIRARLLYQSRKRGTLESDLLLSTFADANLGTMSPELLQSYDRFLDENDWDIYYWATQEPPPTSHAAAEGGKPSLATPDVQGKAVEDTAKKQDAKPDAWRQGQPRSGEWAQTVGTFKAEYRPVPERWAGSEILELLKDHVRQRSAGGVSAEATGTEGKGFGQHVVGTGGGGLGFMPPVKNFDG